MAGRAVKRRNLFAPSIRIVWVNLFEHIPRSGLSTMALQTPTHRERLGLINHFHVLNWAVAGLTSYALRDVRAEIETRMIWKLVNTNPLDRLACFVRFFELLNVRAVGLDDAVTVHTRLDRRDHRVWAALRSDVTVFTIDLVLSGVKLVTVRDGLSRLISFV